MSMMEPYSAGVEIIQTINKGRGLIAGKKFETGQLIMRQQPYAYVIMGTHAQSVCHYCLACPGQVRRNLLGILDFFASVRLTAVVNARGCVKAVQFVCLAYAFSCVSFHLAVSRLQEIGLKN